MLIPIGSFCRPAYQVREFNIQNNIQPESFPFDWTITSFTALQKILSPAFNPSKTFDLKNLFISKLGSISDNYSGLIFHHDLPPHLVNKYHSGDGGKLIDISPELIASDAINNAKGRFIHTFSKFQDYCKNDHQKIGFIRWCRWGNPDPNVPNLLDNENIFALYEILESFCGHNNFYILRVISKMVNELTPEGALLKYQQYSNIGASMLLMERPGLNGDKTHPNGFGGDTTSWTEALTKFTLDFQIRN